MAGAAAPFVSSWRFSPIFVVVAVVLIVQKGHDAQVLGRRAGKFKVRGAGNVRDTDKIEPVEIATAPLWGAVVPNHEPGIGKERRAAHRDSGNNMGSLRILLAPSSSKRRSRSHGSFRRVLTIQDERMRMITRGPSFQPRSGPRFPANAAVLRREELRRCDSRDLP